MEKPIETCFVCGAVKYSGFNFREELMELYVMAKAAGDYCAAANLLNPLWANLEQERELRESQTPK